MGHWGPNCNCNLNSLTPSVAPCYIFVWRPPAFCGRTHLHRIQPRPHVKVIFRYFRPDAHVSLSSAYLHRCISWLTARSKVNMLQIFLLLYWLLNQSETTSLSYNLLIAGGTDRFMPFPRVLTRSETQSASYSIWTRVVDSIEYYDNRNARILNVFTHFLRHEQDVT